MNNTLKYFKEYMYSVYLTVFLLFVLKRQGSSV